MTFITLFRITYSKKLNMQYTNQEIQIKDTALFSTVLEVTCLEGHSKSALFLCISEHLFVEQVPEEGSLPLETLRSCLNSLVWCPFKQGAGPFD